MAVAQGYGKTVTSGSVFAYDVADFRNSFKGKPTTNLLTTINKAGTVNGTYFKTNSGTEVKSVPNVGVRTVHYVNIFNDYSGGSEVCCPAPMGFGDFTVSPSTQYTYQIIYKTTTGYSHPNYMYHYEYNGDAYVTEYGLHDTGRIQDLGDGWKHAWGTFTSNASTNRFITFLFHYEYGVWNKIEVAGIMLTQGNNIIPPTQFLDVGTTRTATQGLLPLVGTSALDLSNVSFNSNAQITFDGTDDYIAAGNPTSYRMGTSNFTLECVMKQSKTSGHCLLESRGDSLAGYLWVHNYYSTGQGCLFLNYGGDQYLYFQDGGFVATTTTQYYHMAIVVNRTANIISFYVNGNKAGNDVSIHNNSISPTGGDRYWVGADLGGSPWQGEIPVFKHYNRTLTAGEVRQNYLHYKTRFNLS
jgi:hypothetical protein